MERMAVQRKVEVPHMAARRRFGGYRREEVQTVRGPDIRADLSGAERLLGFWRENLWQMDLFSVRGDYGLDRYVAMCKLARELEYTPEDVERLSVLLAGHQDEKNFIYRMSGCLSILVNSGPEARYTIPVDHLEVAPEFLGWRNDKDLLILGDAGHHFASSMVRGNVLVKGGAGGSIGSGIKDGMITIEGDAKDLAGNHMEDGVIRIEGSVTDYAAMYMKGGRLLVDCDAGQDLGCYMEGGIVRVKGDVEGISRDMKGGEIHVGGEIGSIGDIRGGRIYHKGKLIVDK